MRREGRLTGWSVALAAALAAGCGGGSGSDGPRDAGADTTRDTADEAGDAIAEPDAPADADETGCASDAECDDADPCTVDTCEVDYGTCAHAPVDADGDGYAARIVEGRECGGDDCDDADGSVHPGAAPDCGGADNDCDDLPDRDEDADGHVTESCGGDDCDDADASVFPGSLDVDCSDADHDCNGHPDRDNDGDGYDRDECPGGNDCEDADALAHPGAEEIICDGKDTDCNGVLSALDEDEDQDGWAEPGCVADGREPDCDDADASVHPGADETCDSVDNDCDGDVLDAPGADDDGDTRLDDACDGGKDCDDTRDDVYMGASETCMDGVDQDCDTIADGLEMLGAAASASDAGRQSFDPVVTWTGSEWAVTFIGVEGAGDRDLFFARLDEAGSRIGSDVRVVDTAGYALAPDVAWTGSVLGLAWSDDSSGDNDVRFKLLDATGADASSAVAVSDTTSTSWEPSLSWTGSEFAVAWEDFRDGDANIYFARLDADGGTVGSEVRVTSETSSQLTPSLVWADGCFGLAWSDSQWGNREIAFVRITAEGTVGGTGVRVTDATGISRVPRLSWRDGRYGVAWGDYRSGQYVVLFALLDGVGSKLGSDVEVYSPASSNLTVSLTPLPDRWAMAWWVDAGTDHAYLASMGADGSLLDAPLAVASPLVGPRNPAVAFSGTEVAVAWQDYGTDPNGIVLDRARLCD